MYQLTNEIILLAIILGVATAAIFGASSKSTKSLLFAFLNCFASIGICIAVMLTAAFIHETCEKALNVCLGTSDENIWNFALFPILCTPIYFVTAYIFKSTGKITVKSEENPKCKYVKDPEADRQIAWIIKIYDHGSSSEGIAATLNSNQEKYLLDNSEWTKEKVDLVVNEFYNKPKLPN